MEAKKSKKAAIENQRGSWLLMGLVVALAFMFVSFEWTQHDVRVAALSSDDESIFVTELVPISFFEPHTAFQAASSFLLMLPVIVHCP